MHARGNDREQLLRDTFGDGRPHLLVDSPRHRVILVLGYPDVYTSGDDTMRILAHQPIGLEGMDDRLISFNRKKGMNPGGIRLLPEGGGILIVEFGGDAPEEAEARAKALMQELERAANSPDMRLVTDPHEAHQIWRVRESGLGATARVPGERDSWHGWEDSAVAPERLGGYLRSLRMLLEKYDLGCSLYGHFGDGCVHTRIDFDLQDDAGASALAREPDRREPSEGPKPVEAAVLVGLVAAATAALFRMAKRRG